MRELGANLARIYLQLPNFTTSPTGADPQALRSVRAVLDAASSAGMRSTSPATSSGPPERAPAW
jgi:hypothetical protein